MLMDQEIACLESTISILKPSFIFTDALLGEKPGFLIRIFVQHQTDAKVTCQLHHSQQ